MIEYLTETGSTNTDVADKLRAGQRWTEGDWLVADRQIAGRGRSGRSWSASSGNFTGSTVVQLVQSDPLPSTLAFVSSLAVAAAVDGCCDGSFALQLKWPNDILVGESKLAGILMEREGQNVIVGIGVNLRTSPPLDDRLTTSLHNLGVDVNRDVFAEALADNFARELERWRIYGLDTILRRWLARAHPVGTAISTTVNDGNKLSGQFAGLTDEGALKLRIADGSLHIIHSGEIAFASPKDA